MRFHLIQYSFNWNPDIDGIGVFGWKLDNLMQIKWFEEIGLEVVIKWFDVSKRGKNKDSFGKKQ